MPPCHVPPVAGRLHRLGHSEEFVPCLGGCCAADQVLQLRFQKQSSRLAKSWGGAGSGAHQELLKTWDSVALSRAVPEHLTKRGLWLSGSVAFGVCGSSSFERSWERCPKTTTGESVQTKGLVSIKVPSAVFSGSSVISCHFRIWTFWT